MVDATVSSLDDVEIIILSPRPDEACQVQGFFLVIYSFLLEKLNFYSVGLRYHPALQPDRRSAGTMTRNDHLKKFIIYDLNLGQFLM